MMLWIVSYPKLFSVLVLLLCAALPFWYGYRHAWQTWKLVVYPVAAALIGCLCLALLFLSLLYACMKAWH